ncbi:MAG TPA: FAD:protein FMN transferase [Pirellulales bacterium]|nr:FAD:protein FMN transferase [Pirellulales bacterium]
MDADRTTNRRQFLTGQAATEALADLATRGEVSPSSPPTADPAAEPYLLQLGRRAMACRFEAYLNAGQYPHATQTVLEALDLIDQLEAQMTVYRDSSELANINRLAAQEPVRVERRLFELFERAAELHRQTRGAFDITSGPLTKVWGFFRRQGAVPGDADLAAALAKVSGDNLQLDANAGTTRFLVAGMELNLGAIGKGYALDRVAELMLAAGVGDFLWHGGQSSILARGSRSGGEGGWLVSLRHPLRPERTLAEIRLRDRALGTSGSGTQFFRHRGKRYGHILDPRTGRPAEGVFSATLLAPTAAEADALATACYVLGAEQALALCGGRSDLGLLMLVPGSGQSAVEFVTSGLTEADWRLTGDVGPVR